MCMCWIEVLDGDMLEHIFGMLFNPFLPCFGVAGIGSTSSTLQARRRNALPWLRSLHAAAMALAAKMGMSCDELCEALTVRCGPTAALNADDMQMLGKLGALLPRLRECSLFISFTGARGVQQLAAGLEWLGAGALTNLVSLSLRTSLVNPQQMGDAGASAIAAAVRNGAMGRLEELRERLPRTSTID